MISFRDSLRSLSINFNNHLFTSCLTQATATINKTFTSSVACLSNRIYPQFLTPFQGISLFTTQIGSLSLLHKRIQSTLTANRGFASAVNSSNSSQDLVNGAFRKIDRFVFPPTAKKVTALRGLYSTAELLKEPDLFAADLDYSLSHCGPIMHSILLELCKVRYVNKILRGEVPGHHIIIDTRVHRIKKGEYLAIPGWHTDFAERSPASGMQPDYSKITPTTTTYVINLSDHPEGVSNTEYLSEAVVLDVPTKQTYLSLDKQINALSPSIVKMRDGDVVEMDQLSLHRGTAAHNDGTRGFLRLAILHDLNTTILQAKPKNEIRKHLQTYLHVSSVALEKERQEKSLCNRKNGFDSKIFSVTGLHDLEASKSSLREIQQVFSVDEIKNEAMIINGSLDYALLHGGPITQKFINYIISHPLLRDCLDKIKFNTRVHMMMKGQYSDIPLWRSGGLFNQNIHSANQGEHLLLLLSSKPEGVSQVEFCTQKISYKEIANSSLSNVEKAINATKKETMVLQDKHVIHYGNGTLHRVLTAHDSGWRLALMATIDDIPAENKTSKQVQVYLEPVSLGW